MYKIQILNQQNSPKLMMLLEELMIIQMLLSHIQVHYFFNQRLKVYLAFFKYYV